MWGRNRLRQELKMRQIDQKLIEKAFKEEIDLDKYWNNLLYLTQKKFNLLASERESFKKINKVKAYLAYKGYEFDLMNDAIETVKTKE
ncbi:regulatory protein RecX [Empedobacter falsenii]